MAKFTVLRARPSDHRARPRPHGITPRAASRLRGHGSPRVLAREPACGQCGECASHRIRLRGPLRSNSKTTPSSPLRAPISTRASTKSARPYTRAFVVRAGQRLSMPAAERGVYGYLAIANGGVDVPASWAALPPT